MWKWGVYVQDAGPDTSSWIINWSSALTEGAIKNVSFACCVKKEMLLPEWQLHSYEIIAITREVKPFTQTTDLSFILFILLLSLPKIVSRQFQRSCDAILGWQLNFGFSQLVGKVTAEGLTLSRKKHGKSREHSISSKTHRKKPIVHAGLWACQPFSQELVLTGSIPKHDDRWLAIMNLHVEHITDSCLFALCPGPRLLGTVRIKMMGEVELRWTFLLYQRHSLP